MCRIFMHQNGLHSAEKWTVLDGRCIDFEIVPKTCSDCIQGCVTLKIKLPYHNISFLYRHNLTLNKAFIKVPRPATEGRGAYWKLENGAESQIFRRMARNYNRPKISARHNIYFCDTTDINTVFIAVPT